MAVDIEQGVDALEKALVLSAQYCDAPERERAHEVLLHVGERARFGIETTVVAFAGGTGAGKSSLMNALLDGNYARVAATRPTTRVAQAVSSAPAPGLLDYLAVPERVVAPGLVEMFTGLKTRGKHARARKIVVLDLPDIDSEVEENRIIAQRLVQRVDVLIWVLDPQKYADAIVHEQYLRTMRSVAGSALVVLNQIDLVPAAQRESVVADVQRLLQADSFTAEVETTSALTGEGIERIRARLNSLVKAKSAMAQRLAGEIRGAAEALRAATVRDGGGEPASGTPSPTAMSAALAQAVGVEAVARAARDSYQIRGQRATSWPVLRGVHSRRVDPLAQRHLAGAALPEAGTELLLGGVVPAQGASTAAGRAAVSTYVRAATAQLPHAWAVHVRAHMATGAADFFAGAQSLFQEMPVAYRRRPLWWTTANLVQWLALMAAVLGGVWLILWNLAGFFQLAWPAPPAWGVASLPVVLLAGGLLAGWGLAVLCVPLVNCGARRTQHRVQRALERTVEKRVQAVIVEPLMAHLERYREFWKALERASHTA
ncbi:MAG: GTPase [Arcanobacterium sp.]|nr:GTPase [Arcanobacterium sp.]